MSTSPEKFENVTAVGKAKVSIAPVKGSSAISEVKPVPANCPTKIMGM